MSSAEAGSDDLCRPSIVISQEKETEKLSNNNIFDKSTSINQDNWNMTIRSIDSNFTSCSQLSVTSSVSMIQSVASNQSTVYVVDAFSAGIIGDYSRNNDITETSSGTNENIYSRHINGDISSNFSSHGIPSDIYLEFSDTSSISRTAKSYGKTIDENHVNFVLMYDMLTGIRHSVSACQAKPLKFIEESDFKYSRTYNFVSDSNETTPSKYEFRFKDYCPWVFRSLREAFKIDAADYLVSLTGKYALSEIGSPGKSGSFFYFSQDFRYIIKTIRQSEHEFLRKILQHYYEHIKKNSNSLITRFYGLHRVKMNKLKKHYFVVMGNIFPPHRDVHETYDLKGSTYGRYVGLNELVNIDLATLKDLNWIERARKLKLGPEKATLLMNQLIADCSFLSKMRIMDYSLLTGIHYISRGNLDRIRDRSMMVYEPINDELYQSKIKSVDNKEKKIPTSFKPSAISASTVGDHTGVPQERKTCIFYRDDGGFRSSTRDGSPGNEIYYLGIIDILTPYSVAKKIEHIFKSVKLDRRTISAINPLEYSKRFLRFMAENIFQDSTADYSSKPLPRLPSPKFRSREILYDSQSFLLIENSTEEEADNFDSDSKTIVK